MLALRGLTRLYGGVRALDRVDLDLHAAELHLLTGPGGSGKSTLLRLLAGFEQPSAGELLVAGQPVRLGSPLVAQRLGIGFAGDAPLVLEELTVAEHVTLGAEPARAGCLRRRRARREVAALAARLGLCTRSGFDVRARVGSLDLAGRRQVELLALAWRGSGILLLDEPLAGLLPAQAERVVTALATLRAEGRALLVATRAPERLARVADRITVLQDGRVTGATPTAVPEAAPPSGFASAQGAAAPPPRRTVAAESGTCKRLSTESEQGEEQILQVKGLWVISDVNHGDRELVAGLDLVVHRGEIHAVAAAGGQGAEELIEALLGARRPDGGRIYLGDEDVTRASVHARRRHGLAYLPPDGAPGGLVADLSLRHNVFLGGVGRGRRGRRRAAAIVAEAAMLPAPATVAGDAWLPARAAPRHHRQRLLLARELAGRPKVLLAACPTRGLRRDQAEPLWQALRAARDRGLAMLLWSTDPEELDVLADRVTLMAGGRAVGELAGRALTAAALHAALHAPPAPPASPSERTAGR